MKTLLLTTIALLLAIPTFGLSLLLWFWIKHAYDSKAVNLILIEAKISFQLNGDAQKLFGINNASIRRVFSQFSNDYSDYDIDGGSGLGKISHPI